MIKGQTQSGFDYAINEKALGDWRFLKAMADLDSGDDSRALGAMPIVVSLLMGKDQARFEEHITDAEGYQSTEMVLADLKDIFAHVKETNQGKNS